MTITISAIRIGDVLQHWFDTGAFGLSPVYSRVLKVGKKKVLVRCETGQQKWLYPGYFCKQLSSAETAEAQIRWQ
jgi:hypothetical protein